MSLAFMVSTLSVIPVAFLHSWVIWPLSSTSEAGTKSAQRNQWTDVSCANAGARPVARMAARPPLWVATALAPDIFRSLRRVMRVIVFLPLVVLRWHSACSRLRRRDRCVANRGSRGGNANAPGNAPLEYPIQPEPQSQSRMHSTLRDKDGDDFSSATETGTQGAPAPQEVSVLAPHDEHSSLAEFAETNEGLQARRHLR